MGRERARSGFGLCQASQDWHEKRSKMEDHELHESSRMRESEFDRL